MKTLIIIILIAVFVTNGDASSLSTQEHTTAEQLDARLTQTVSIADLVTYAYLNNPSILSVRGNRWQ